LLEKTKNLSMIDDRIEMIVSSTLMVAQNTILCFTPDRPSIVLRKRDRHNGKPSLSG